VPRAGIHFFSSSSSRTSATRRSLTASMKGAPNRKPCWTAAVLAWTVGVTRAMIAGGVSSPAVSSRSSTSTTKERVTAGVARAVARRPRLGRVDGTADRGARRDDGGDRCDRADSAFLAHGGIVEGLSFAIRKFPNSEKRHTLPLTKGISFGLSV